MWLKEKIPLSHALMWIFFSTLLVSGSVTAILYSRQQTLLGRLKDPDYAISEVAETGPDAGSVPPDYLFQLLGLDFDEPINIYQFSLKQAERRLLDSALFATVKVSRIPPGRIVVDYRLRQPVWNFGTLTNTAIDRDGVLFPYAPFHKVPAVSLFMEPPASVPWGTEIDLQFAKVIFQWAADLPVFALDLRDAEHESLGRRQVIVTLQETLAKQEGTYTFLRHLRLNPRDVEGGLERYRLLQKRLLWQSPSFCKGADAVIDLRLPGLAYLNL